MAHWQELVQGFNPDCRFAPPATEEVLEEVEKALGVAVPDELLGLWRECNGIKGKYGAGIWSAEETIRENLELRSYPEQNDLYMSFDPLFCFAWAGNGDLFFFPIQAGGIHNPDIFLWNHENDSRTWVANDLETFVSRWFRGQLDG